MFNASKILLALKEPLLLADGTSGRLCSITPDGVVFLCEKCEGSGTVQIERTDVMEGEPDYATCECMKCGGTELSGQKPGTFPDAGKEMSDEELDADRIYKAQRDEIDEKARQRTLAQWQERE